MLFLTQQSFLQHPSANWSWETSDQQQGRTHAPQKRQFACYVSDFPISTSRQAARQSVTTPSSLLLSPSSLQSSEKQRSACTQPSTLPVLHSTMGNGHSCLKQHLAGVSSNCKVFISCLYHRQDGLS